MPSTLGESLLDEGGKRKSSSLNSIRDGAAKRIQNAFLSWKKRRASRKRKKAQKQSNSNGSSSSSSSSGGGGGGGHGVGSSSRAGPMSRSELIGVVLKTLFYILSWYTFSIGLTFYNKWLFAWHDFHFPLSVTTVHMICTFGWAAVSRKVFAKKGVPNAVLTWSDVWKRVYPAGGTAALDIGLSNLAITTGLHINIYTVCKSTVLVFTLLFAIMFRLQKATWQLALVITLIFGGVVLFLAKGTGGDPIDGFGFLLVASVMGGLRWVLAQILIERGGLKFSGTFDTLYYVAPCMALTLFPFAVGLEGKKLMHSGMLFACDNGTASVPPLYHNMSNANFSERIAAANAATAAANAAADAELAGGAAATWVDGGYVTLTNCRMEHEQTMNIVWIFMGAFLAFMLTFSEFILVGYAGSLTFSVAGIAKELVTIGFAAALVKGNGLSVINVLGLLISISGIVLYNYVKYNESRSPEASAYQRVMSEENNGELGDGAGSDDDDEDGDSYNIGGNDLNNNYNDGDGGGGGHEHIELREGISHTAFDELHHRQPQADQQHSSSSSSSPPFVDEDY